MKTNRTNGENRTARAWDLLAPLRPLPRPGRERSALRARLGVWPTLAPKGAPFFQPARIDNGRRPSP